MQNTKILSVIVPCYNEAEVLPFFWKEIKCVANYMLLKYDLQFEYIFINDGSTDATLSFIHSMYREDKKVRYISFSRNFGKEAAIYAGLQYSRGDYVVLMDADLQHPPAMLEDMYNALALEQYDIVAAKRVSRKGEPIIRSVLSKIFYYIINKISKAEFVNGASDFRMLSRKAVDAILQISEYNRFSKGIFGWIGFQTKWLPYENVERVAGKTKWSFGKLLLYSIEGIVGFSTIPLSISSFFGVLLCLFSFVWLIRIIIDTCIWGNAVAGFPTLICLLLMIWGTIQLSLGIIGQYLAKTYLESKHRPVYIVAETEQFLQKNE